MKNLKNYVRASSVDDALRQLKEQPGAKLLAGGTTIVKLRDQRVETLVDIKTAGIDYIKVNGEVRIGAATRIQDIAKSEELAPIGYGIMGKVASAVGSTLIRNLVTLGGNIVQLYYWSDMPVALLLLDADVTIKGDNSRIVGAKEYFAKNPKLTVSHQEIVSEVSFDIPDKDRVFDFIKFAKTKFDYSIINVGTAYTLTSGNCGNPRIVISAATKLPMRAEKAEAFLDGKEATEENFKKAGEIAAEEVDMTNDYRASKEYRENVLPVLIKRSLIAAMQLKGQ